jgi:hypothetical protein
VDGRRAGDLRCRNVVLESQQRLGIGSEILLDHRRLYVSPAGRRVGVSTKTQGSRDSLAESDARVNVVRHGQRLLRHLNAFPLHKDRQANAYPKEEAPAKGRNERKKCQAGETVTMTDGRQR